ncbi:MAG: hypothetical protein M1497_07640 [Nitrospirae bacterium]|nr:hypothetical protein [Nitrospirota bacterium]
MRMKYFFSQTKGFVWVTFFLVFTLLGSTVRADQPMDIQQDSNASEEFMPLRAPSPGANAVPPVTCFAGSYEIEGPPLFPGRSDGLGTEVTVLGVQMSIPGACPEVLGRVRLGLHGTSLLAHWTSCSGTLRNVTLSARLDGFTCRLLDGALILPGATRRFQAHLKPLSETGDGTVGGDGDGGGTPAGGGSNSGTIQMAFQRYYLSLSQRTAPKGYMPKGALSNANRQIAAMPISFDRWVSLGGPAEGAVNALAVDPLDTAHWLAGGAYGGIWETHDAGATWTPRSDEQLSLAISAIAFAPSSLNVVYAGTGSYGIYPGIGILKSIDGGATWGLISGQTFAGLGVSAIRVSASSPSVAVVSTMDHIASLFPDAHFPPGPKPKPGVYATDTGGSFWNLTLQGNATDVVIHPTWPWLYAALGASKGDPSNGVYRTKNNGTKWDPISGPWSGKSGGVGEIKLASAPSNPNTLYVSVRDAYDGKGKDGRLLGLWKTTNAWDDTPVWTEIPWNGPQNTDYMVGRTFHTITVHPTDPHILYAGGVFLYKYDGAQWHPYSGAFHSDGSIDYFTHVDHNALAWVPPLNLLDGNDGGVAMKNEDDEGSLWQGRGGNLVLGALYSGDVKPASLKEEEPAPAAVLAGVVDSGVHLMDVSVGSWSKLLGGDGMDVFFGANSKRGGWSLYGGTPYLMRRTTGTPNGATVSESIPVAELYGGGGFRMKPCPANDNIVLFGGDHLLRSDNFFSAPTRQDVVWTVNSASLGIVAVAFASSDTSCQTYAVSDKNDKVYLTADGGSHWKVLNPGSQLPARTVESLAFSPVSADILYAALSGFNEGTPGQPGHLFRTGDAKDATPIWTNVSPPVNIPCNVVAVHPSFPATIYAGTDLGVWVSNDDGATWYYSGAKSGLPNAPVMDLAIDPCGVTAFTYGRGAFRNSVPFVCPGFF